MEMIKINDNGHSRNDTCAYLEISWNICIVIMHVCIYKGAVTLLHADIPTLQLRLSWHYKMSFVNKLSAFARSFATTVKPVYRGATAVKPVYRRANAKDAASITRMAIQEGWHVGPYDFPTYFEFDPKSYNIGEVDRQYACHIGVIEFPKHHYHGGGVMVADRFRQTGYSTVCVKHGLSVVDKRYTVGTDINLSTLAQYESLGFEKFWDTYVAMFDLEKIAKVGIDQKSSSFAMPIQDCLVRHETS